MCVSGWRWCVSVSDWGGGMCASGVEGRKEKGCFVVTQLVVVVCM